MPCVSYGIVMSYDDTDVMYQYTKTWILCLVSNDIAIMTLSTVQGYDRIKYFTKFVMSQLNRVQKPTLHSAKSNSRWVLLDL